MADATKTDSLSPRRQFSLWQLMLCVVIISLFLGLVRVVFPDDFVVTYVLIVAGMAGVIGLLALLGKVRLVPMLAILASLGVVIGYIFQPVYSHRRPSPCTNNLRQIAMALTIYEGEYASLPPPYIADAKGKPMHSWRVLILPYLGEQRLYDEYRFDEPWDGPNNRKLHDRIVDVYRCPQDHPNCFSTAATQTSYVVVVGPGTAFPGGRRKISIADVANWDGVSNTILVAEVHDSGIHWMSPRDLDFATMDFQINGKSGAAISSKHSGGAMAVMADGSVRYLDDKTPPKVVERLITVKDGNSLPQTGEQ